MKMRSMLCALGAALCVALASVAYAAAGPVPAAVGVALAQVAPVKTADPLVAIVAPAPAAQAMPAADNATASASERLRTGTLPGQAMADTSTRHDRPRQTAEVGHVHKALAAGGKGCGKPPRKLTA